MSRSLVFASWLLALSLGLLGEISGESQGHNLLISSTKISSARRTLLQDDLSLTIPDGWEDTKASSTLDYCGRMSMYVHKIIKEALLIHLQYKVDENMWLIQHTEQQFLRVTSALRDGDHYLKIRPVTEETALSELENLSSAFAALQTVIQRVVAQNGTNTTDLDDFVATAPGVLQAIDRMRAIVGTEMMPQIQYAPEIELATSLRTNSQKMIAEYLFVVSKYDIDTYNAALQVTAEEFDTSLYHLLNGDPSRDLNPAVDYQVIQWLELIKQLWEGEDGFKRVMEIYPTIFRMEFLAGQSTPLLGRTNMVVALYQTSASKPGPPPPVIDPPPSPPPENGSSNPGAGLGSTMIVGLFGVMLSAAVMSPTRA